MKKILLLTTSIFALSTNVSADMIENRLYFRGDLLASKFNNIHVEGYKYKGQVVPSFDAGIGYNFLDNVRAELIYIHVATPTFKHNRAFNSNAKVNIESIMLRGFVDIIELDYAKIFGGVGVGESRVRHRITTFNNEAGVNKSKFKYNVAAHLIVGASFDLGRNGHLDIGYLHASYGSTKGFKSSLPSGKIGLRSHNAFLGFRYDL